MNVLVLDPKTVCVEKSEIYQAEQLDKLGMEVIPVDLRDAYGFGGGLHCCTADVYKRQPYGGAIPSFALIIASKTSGQAPATLSEANFTLFRFVLILAFILLFRKIIF